MKKLIYILFSILIFSAFFASGAYAKKLLYAATVDGMMEMYLSPDKDSLKITDVPGCAELNLIKTEGTWGNVVFANKSGWINTSFTRTSYEEAAEATGFESLKNVKTNFGKNRVGLYTLPSYELKYGSEKKYTVPDGIVLKVTRETHDGWGLVSVNDEYLWVNLKDTEPYITETEQAIEDYELYYVYTFSDNGSGVSLMSEPGGNNVLATVCDCVKLTVRDTEKNYAYVSYNGINGWVNLDSTTKSFSNAMTKTGKTVNAEYKITGEASSSVDIFNVPSNKIKDGAVSVGSVSSGTNIFVQRCTADGWMLVNHNGKIGWIPPGNAELQPNDDSFLITPLDKKWEGYVATGKENGLPLYSQYDGKTVVARIPECVRVEILAEKDGRQYVYCDYASGWALPEGITGSYKKAIGENYLKKALEYTVRENTSMMSLPMEELLCSNEKLLDIKKGTELKILRIVTTGKTKWGLAEINGVKGWVNLGKTSRVYSPVEIALFVLVSLLGAGVIVFAIIFLVRKIRNRKKNVKAPEETAEEFAEKEEIESKTKKYKKTVDKA